MRGLGESMAWGPIAGVLSFPGVGYQLGIKRHYPAGIAQILRGDGLWRHRPKVIGRLIMRWENEIISQTNHHKIPWKMGHP